MDHSFVSQLQSQPNFKNSKAPLTPDLLIANICAARFTQRQIQCMDLSLSADRKIGERVKPHLMCPICVVNVVRDPIMCQACETLYCGKCIGQRLLQNPCCPHCQQIFQAAGRIPFPAAQELSEMNFQCLTCYQSYNYLNAFTHELKCLPPKFSCVLECGMPFQFRSSDELRSHFDLDCLKMPLNCTTCQETATRGQPPHDCAVNLQKTIMTLKLQIAIQARDFKKIIQDQNVIINQQQDTIAKLQTTAIVTNSQKSIIQKVFQDPQEESKEVVSYVDVWHCPICKVFAQNTDVRCKECKQTPYYLAEIIKVNEGDFYKKVTMKEFEVNIKNQKPTWSCPSCKNVQSMSSNCSVCKKGFFDFGDVLERENFKKQELLQPAEQPKSINFALFMRKPQQSAGEEDVYWKCGNCQNLNEKTNSKSSNFCQRCNLDSFLFSEVLDPSKEEVVIGDGKFQIWVCRYCKIQNDAKRWKKKCCRCKNPRNFVQFDGLNLADI